MHQRSMTWVSLLALLVLSPTATAATPATAAPDGAAPETASAEVVPAGPCSTPRGAVVTWMDNLREESYAPAQATACFNSAFLGLDESEMADRAVKLKRILDARGIGLDPAEIPDDPAYEGEPPGRYLLTAELEEVYLERVGDRWLVSSPTVRATERLFDGTFSPLVRGLVRLLPEFALAELIGIQLWKWIGLLVLIFVALGIQRLSLFLVTHQIKRLTTLLRAQWPRRVVDHIGAPVSWLAIAGVLALGLPQLELPLSVAKVGAFVTRLVGLLSVIWLCFRAIHVITDILAERASKTKSKLDDQLVPLVRTVAQVFVGAVGVLFVLQNLKVDVSSLLAGLGIGGLAFALAAKESIGNFFGSITIFLDKPFQLGDWIKVGGVEGFVEEVGLRSTRVRTFYDSVITIPNATFSDVKVDNMGMRRYRNYWTSVGVQYDTPPDKLQAMIEGIRAIIEAHPATLKDRYQVHFKDLSAYSLDIQLYMFFDVPTWTQEQAAKHQVLMEILRLAERLGVSFAFPSQSLYVEQTGPEAATKAPTDTELAGIVEGFGPGGELARPTGQMFSARFPADSKAVPRS